MERGNRSGWSRLRGAVGRGGLRVHTLDSLRFGRFRHYWAAILLSSGVQWLQQVVVGWLTYDVSRSPFLTVLALGLGTLPYLLTAPIGGVLADRVDRARLLASIYCGKALVYAVFSVVVIAGWVEVWHVFAFVITMGLLQSVAFPARQSIVPSVVPRDYLVNAFAVMLLTSSTLQLALPTLTGLSIEVQGPGPTLLVGAVMYLGAAIAVGTIRLPAADRMATRTESVLGQFADGLRYVRRDPVLLPVVLMSAAVYILIVPTVHGLLPVYASEVFDVGPVGLGLMASSLGVGAALGALILASVRTLRHKGRLMVGCLVLSLVAAAAFSRSPSLLVALPLIVLVNVGFDGFAMVRTASIQIVAPDAMRGRATAVNSMGSGLAPIGGVALGVVAQMLGAPFATLIGAVLMALVLLLIVHRYRQIWRFD